MRLQLNAECPTVVRRVRKLILSRMGCDAAIVFSEAVANVREHSGVNTAELTLHINGFSLSNHHNGHFTRTSEKPAGEGGYGLHIIEGMGACVNCSDGTTSITWQKHVL